MTTIVRFLESTRLYMLLFSVPYAALWSSAAHSGGWLMVIEHALLVLFYFLSFDRSMLDRGLSPRLALVRDKEARDYEFLSVWRILVGIAALALGLVLLATQTWVGIASLIVLVLIATTTGAVGPESRRWRFRFAALLLPLAILIAPALLIQGFSETVASEDRVADVISRRDMLATFIGALMLSIYVLLCLIRDEPADRGMLVRTTATVFGRNVAVAFIFLIAVLTIIISTSGVEYRAWTGGVAAIVAIASMIVLWSLAEHADDHAVGAWTIGHALAALLLILSPGIG